MFDEILDCAVYKDSQRIPGSVVQMPQDRLDADIGPYFYPSYRQRSFFRLCRLQHRIRQARHGELL